MDNEEENQKTDEIIIPYFAIRIINDESLNPDVVNKFIEEFLIEYINNLDIRNQSEGIFITFTNEDYIFSENFNDAINSNDGKKFVVKIESVFSKQYFRILLFVFFIIILNIQNCI